MKDYTLIPVFAALFALLLLPKGVFAQQQVSGTVRDSSDADPLPGVNIVVKGTMQGTSSGPDGTFQLTAPSLSDTLTFSFVGYQAKEVPIDGRTQIDVELASQALLGEEIVVVGYGTQQRQQITGSVSSVDARDFVRGSVNNPSELIQGKVPGLVVASEGGDPNQDPTIRLRGVTTFSGSAEPLVVVDGIIGASLSNVDPNDIASIDVLKDASAAAIYGTRGASGVIVVTTKSGKAGAQALEMNYSGSVGVVTVENRLDVLNAAQFRELSDIVDQPITDLGHDTDWFEEVSQTGYNNIHNLALSGGTESTAYRISGNFRANTGIQRETGFEQINGRLNLTQWTLDDKLSITFNLAATNREMDLGFDNTFRYAATYNPTAPVRDPNGEIRNDRYENTGGFVELAAFDVLNPVAIVETANNAAERQNFNGAIRAEYEFRDWIPGLSASAFYSMQTESHTKNTFHAKTNKSVGGATQFSRGAGLAQRSVDDEKNELFEVTANYVTGINELSLESIAGYSLNDFEFSGTSVSGGDFVSDYVGADNMDFAQDFNQGEGDVASYRSTNRIVGYFARVNLNWDNTYFLNSSYRREGSSRFGENEKWGDFWAAGAGVELTNLIEVGFMDRFKLRSSYGVTGNDAPFNGISKLRFAPRGNFFVGGSFVQSFGPVSNANPDLKWEENYEYNIGADFELFNSRLAGAVEYYSKTTKDLLFEVQVPVPPNLYPTTWENVGELRNRGVEANLNYDVFRQPNLNWNTGFTFSTFNTILSEFISDDEIFISNAGSPGQNGRPLMRVQEGSPIGQMFGPVFAGIGDDGEWRFYNQDGEKVKISEITRADERVLGSGLPDFSLGWTNSFNYKNWRVSTFFRGVFGHDMVNQFRLFYETPTSIATWNVLESAFDLTELTASPPQYSSYHVEDASFVRFQNAAISYDVPLPEDSPVRALTLSLTGNDLFTITNYRGIDPEIDYSDEGANGGGDGGPLAPGIERRNNWFTPRSVTFGVDANF